MLERMNSSYFDWLTWRNGSPLDMFGIRCSTGELILNTDTLRKYAVGWCPGESLVCRPKLDHVAVVFIKDDVPFWFHLRRDEFDLIFKRGKY